MITIFRRFKLLLFLWAFALARESAVAQVLTSTANLTLHLVDLNSSGSYVTTSPSNWVDNWTCAPDSALAGFTVSPYVATPPITNDPGFGLSFSGSNFLYLSGTDALNGSFTGSLFIVAQTAVGSGDLFGTGLWSFGFVNSRELKYSAYGGTKESVLAAMPAAVASWGNSTIYELSGTGKTISISIDGGVTTVSAGKDPAAHRYTCVCIGASGTNLSINSSMSNLTLVSANGCYNGNINEILYFSQECDNSQRNNVLQYLSNTYNIPVAYATGTSVSTWVNTPIQIPLSGYYSGGQLNFQVEGKKTIVGGNASNGYAATTSGSVTVMGNVALYSPALNTPASHSATKVDSFMIRAGDGNSFWGTWVPVTVNVSGSSVGLPDVSIATSTPFVLQGDTADFTCTRTGLTGEALSVSFTDQGQSAGTAISGQDYAPLSTESVSIKKNDISANTSVKTYSTGNTTDKTLTLSVQSNGAYSPSPIWSSSATTIIYGKDSAPTFVDANVANMGSGTYAKGTMVYLNCATSHTNAFIRYTTSNVNPTATSGKAVAPGTAISITGAMTLKAAVFIYDSTTKKYVGPNSDVTTVNYKAGADPSVMITAPATNSVADYNPRTNCPSVGIVIAGSVTDPGEGISSISVYDSQNYSTPSVLINLAGATSYSGTLPITLTPGSHSITAQLTDNFGFSVTSTAVKLQALTLPVITKRNGDNQNWLPNSFLPQALSVAVTNTSNVPMKIPVTFTVSQGTGLLSASNTSSSSLSGSLTVSTDSQGHASVYYHDGPIFGDNSQIQVATGYYSDSFAETTSPVVALWYLDDGSGTCASDSSNTGNNANLNGGFSWVTGYDGKGAVSLDGSSGYLSVASSPTLALGGSTSPLSISSWIQLPVNLPLDNESEIYPIVTFNDTIMDRLSLRVRGGGHGVEAVLTTGTGSVVIDGTASSSVLTNGNWHDVGFAYDGNGNAIIVIDGVQSASQSGVVFPTAPSSLVRLGKDMAGNYFSGKIDNTEISLSALSASNFGGIYDTDSTGCGLPDWWQEQYFGYLGVDPDALAPRGDGLTIQQAYQDSVNPVDYLNGVVPQLTKVGGDNQNGVPYTFLTRPLSVLLTDTNNVPLVNVPVTFTVTQGTGLVATDTTSSTPDGSVTVRTGTNGQAVAYYQEGISFGDNSQIQAAVGNYTVMFAETANPIVALWTFSEASGTTAADSSNSGNTATINGGVSWINGYNGNGAVALDGTSGCLSVAPSPTLALAGSTGALTVAAWVQVPGNLPLDNDTEIYPILSFNNSGTEYLSVGVRGGGHGVETVLTTGSASVIIDGTAGSSVLTDNNWHQVGFIYDGNGNATILIDGTQQNTQTVTTFPSALSPAVWLGRNVAGNYFKGLLSGTTEVRQGTLSPADYNYLFGTGGNAATGTPVTSSSLIATSSNGVYTTGTYALSGTQTVTFAPGTGQAFYYTTDGSDPLTSTSQILVTTGPLTLTFNSATVLRTIAVSSGFNTPAPAPISLGSDETTFDSFNRRPKYLLLPVP